MGNVSTQAVTIERATPQRTAENRLVAPAPMTAEVMVWVVEIGASKTYAVVYSTEAATDSEANPRAGSRWMMRRPRVRMMRQPPAQVPAEMAAAAEKITQNGSGSPSATYPPASRARKITPIVFWASCRPWPRAMAAAETLCATLKPRWARVGLARRKVHMIATITRNPREKATSGESSIGMTTLPTTTPQSALAPAARAAPTSPPMSAWEEEDGSPYHQVMRFHVIAPSRPAITITSACEPVPGSMVSETVVATFCPRKAPTKFMIAAIASATRGVSARVETEVAIALAASWKPLV